jgi:hypothetical protein
MEKEIAKERQATSYNLYVRKKDTPQQERGIGTHALSIKHELVYTYMNGYMGIKDKI